MYVPKVLELLDDEVCDALATLVVEDRHHQPATNKISANSPGLEFAMAELPAEVLLGNTLWPC